MRNSLGAGCQVPPPLDWCGCHLCAVAVRSTPEAPCPRPGPNHKYLAATRPLHAATIKYTLREMHVFLLGNITWCVRCLGLVLLTCLPWNWASISSNSLVIASSAVLGPASGFGDGAKGRPLGRRFISVD